MRNTLAIYSGLMPLLILGVAVVADENTQKPNIIIILADDMGYGDCGLYHPESKIATPNMDQLSREGLLFTDAHAASGTCTPSRYGLLTGINPVRTGVLNTLLRRGDPIISEDEKTIASLLQNQGYVTCMVGKWHLGFEEDKSGKKPALDLSKPLVGGPLDRGFDSFYGIASSPGASPLCFIRGRNVVDLPTEKGTVQKVRGGEEPVAIQVMMSPGYVPEEVSPSFCREAVEFIRAHAASDIHKPLFLYYASPIPHQPWVPTASFKGKSGVGDYGDFMMQLDDVVGQIRDVLKETGLDQNTLLMFTSDNGPGPWAVKAMEEAGHDSAGGLRGKKSDSWEGGHRVPFIATWPGRIPASSRSDAVINFTDVFATLAELLEVDPAKSYPGSAADSISFLPVLLDPAKPHPRPAMINRYAIRVGDWKLVAKHKPRDLDQIEASEFGLYNLADDIAEQNDLSDNEPEKAKKLFAQFKTYMDHQKLK